MWRSPVRGTLAATLLTLCALWPLPAAAVDLPRVLRDVLRRNPGISAARFEAVAARERAVRAGSWSSPMLEFGVVNVPTNRRFDMDPMTMKMVGITQRVPVFGANRLSRRAGEAAASADTAMLSAMRWERCGEAWAMYAEAYFSGERAATAARHRGVMQRMVDAARARYASGRGRLEDMLRAEAEAASVAVDAADFTARSSVAHAGLAALTGAPASVPLGALDPPPVIDVGTDPRAWLDAALLNPQLAVRDANVRRYELDARAARRMAWPDIELKASYGFRTELSSEQAHLGPTEQDNMFSVSAGFMLPLFARSREYAEAREMSAMAQAAVSERAATTLELERAVTAAHARAIAAARIVRLVADTVLVVQHRGLDAAWSSYTAGTSDLLSLFETAHALYMSELREIDERAALARAHATLVSVTGRFDLIGVAVGASTEEGSAR